jgi:choline-sulfatase
VLRRVFLALAGSTLGALLIAVLEANATASGSASLAALARIDLGLIAPLTVFVGVAVGLASYLLAPAAARAPWEPAPRVAAAEAALEPVVVARSRARRAAAGVLTVVCFALWTAAMGPLAAQVLSAGAPLATGARLALLAGFALGAAVGLGLALVRPMTGLVLAMTSPRSPARPGLATVVALAIAAAIFGCGIASGDPSGSKGGLQLFAVLGRHELDLRPAADLLVVAVFAYAATWALVRVRFMPLVGAAGAAAILALTAFESKDLDQHTDLALALEREAPLGRTMLTALRNATDRDHDGAARLFGGGDCNDRDPSVNPNALDVPGNGIDEDCSGEDEPVGGAADRTMTAEGDGAAGAAGATGTDGGTTPALPTVSFHGETYNLLLITVDTLRTDVGFLGYPKLKSDRLTGAPAFRR